MENSDQRGKILTVMARLQHSGTETMLRAIGPALRARGWDSHVLALSDSDSGPFAADLRQAGHIIHHIRFRRNLMLFADLWQLLNRHRFNIVHIQSERANLWVALLALLSGARVIRTVNAVFDFRGGLRLRRMLQRRISRRLGVEWIAPSQSVIAHEASRFGNPCALLPNWIDGRRFPIRTETERLRARTLLGYQEDTFVIASAGSCSPVKNHSAILQALALLPENVRYLHLGTGPLEADEQALATALGIAHRVHWYGCVDDVATALAPADAFLMPSFNEALGLAAVEAMAIGLPCLLSRVNGLSDLQDFNPDGDSCDTTAPSIAEAVRRQKDKPQAALRARAAARARRIQASFGIEQGLRNLMALYGKR